VVWVSEFAACSSSGVAMVGRIAARPAPLPGLSHNVDGTRYFWFHHTEADNVDKIDPRELAENVAAMAIMAYVLADLPQPLPRGGRPVGGRER